MTTETPPNTTPEERSNARRILDELAQTTTDHQGAWLRHHLESANDDEALIERATQYLKAGATPEQLITGITDYIANGHHQ
jgi:type II secretory pathway predicted ATPase ExeA